MSFAIKRTIILLVVIAAGCALLSTGDGQAASPEARSETAASAAAAQDPSDDVLRLAARRFNLPVEALSLVNSAAGSYPELGQTVQRYKIMDIRDGEIYRLVLDEAGNIIDPAEQAEFESQALQAAGGRIAASLSARMAQAQDEEAIPVIIWLNEGRQYSLPPRPDPDANLTEDQAREFLRQVDSTLALSVASVTAPISSRLSGMGVAVSTDVYAPVVYTSLTPAQIREASGWAEVDTIYLDTPNYPELESVFPTVRANIVFGRRIIGRGVKVGLVEVGGRGDPENPYLQYYTQDPTDTCPADNNLFLDHTTGVLGIIYSSHPILTGLATGSEVWVGGACDGSSPKMQARSNAAVDWGANVLNLSWGADRGLQPEANDRFFDNLWYTRYRVVVKSSGNNVNITSPGLAYNIITVGNMDDRNTGNWADDIMNPSSSWKESDPVSNPNDREKPEVVAPGTDINSTVPDDPDTGSVERTGSIGTGSSYSAPVVTGIAAQIMQRRLSLQAWPEIVKAVIMASAVNNIEGNPRLSEHDGAGGVSAEHADDIARGFGGGVGGKKDYLCSNIPASETIATINLSAGQLVRAVIVWNQDPNYDSYAIRPGADLDLVVMDPDGKVVTSSASEDNTYEIVHFTPTKAGDYRLVVRKTRCNANPKFLGWAWMQIPHQVTLPMVFTP